MAVAFESMYIQALWEKSESVKNCVYYLHLITSLFKSCLTFPSAQIQFLESISSAEHSPFYAMIE